jgi:phage-related protein
VKLRTFSQGKNNQTLCAVGCLLTSITEAYGGWGVAISGKEADPEQMNAFLQQHGGYVQFIRHISLPLQKATRCSQYHSNLSLCKLLRLTTM